MTRTQQKTIAVVCGMALYWGMTILGQGIVSRRFSEPPTVGAALFMLWVGPYAMLAFGLVVLTALKLNRILWACIAGVTAAIASLFVVTL